MKSNPDTCGRCLATELCVLDGKEAQASRCHARSCCRLVGGSHGESCPCRVHAHERGTTPQKPWSPGHHPAWAPQAKEQSVSAGAGGVRLNPGLQVVSAGSSALPSFSHPLGANRRPLPSRCSKQASLQSTPAGELPNQASASRSGLLQQGNLPTGHLRAPW